MPLRSIQLLAAPVVLVNLAASSVGQVARPHEQVVAPPAAATRGEPAFRPLVTVSKGSLPIILSSPHGGRTAVPDAPPRKGGRAVEKFIAARDENTAELTERLADAIERELGGRPYVVIARFERKFADANRDAANAYEHENARRHYDAFHAALERATAGVRAGWGRGLLLDVHGQSAAADGVYRGTRDGRAVSELIRREGEAAVTGPTSVFGALAALGYQTFPPVPAQGIGKEERYNGGYITDAYGSHQGTAIDAIQLEFGTALRKTDRLDKTAADAAKAVAAFARAYLPGK